MVDKTVYKYSYLIAYSMMLPGGSSRIMSSPLYRASEITSYSHIRDIERDLMKEYDEVAAKIGEKVVMICVISYQLIKFSELGILD